MPRNALTIGSPAAAHIRWENWNDLRERQHRHLVAWMVGNIGIGRQLRARKKKETQISILK